MSEKDNGGWSHGTFVNLAKYVPGTVTDFSDCETDIPEDQWSHGTFVSASRYVPPGEIDHFDADCEPAVWLELEVSFDEGVAPATVADHTFALGDAVRAAVPELGLTYDSVQSRKRTREEGAVVFALKPRNAVGAAARLAEVADVIRKATATIAADIRVRVSGQAA